MLIGSVFSLNTLIIIGMIVSAVLALVFDKILSSVIAMGICGIFAALEFVLLQAPDVAISEAAVGAVLSTALFVIVIRKITKGRKNADEEK